MRSEREAGREDWEVECQEVPARDPGSVDDGHADPATRLVRGPGGRVLLLSMRRLARLVAFCLQYELEDVAAEVTGADCVEVNGRAALERSRRAYKLLRLATRSRSFSLRLAPRPSTVTLERDYDLFFPVFNNAYELFALAAVPGWRRRCARAACFVNEIWPHLLPGYLLEQLADFDHVFLGVRHSVEEVSRIVRRPCSYLPFATDVLRFTPLPANPPRLLDVCNVGRRSPVTHEALLRLFRGRRISYFYDTVASSGPGGKQRTFEVEDPAEHRLLLAGLLQRSRYFIANRGRVNEPELTRGRDEIAARFYEGAAAGTVMLGEAPQTPEFARQFGWPDAVVPLPFHSPDVGRLLAELDHDPQRLERIRRDNMTHAALRHDWVHRLAVVFETLGIPPTPGMQARQRRLERLAGEITPKVARATTFG
jgi:glycosyl transferase family 1